MKRIKKLVFLLFNGKVKNDESFRPLIVLLSIITAIWILSPFIIKLIINKRGTFGDSFGAVNTLFSGLAFGGIIYTILLQRNELKLQRKELKLTKAELKRSADAHEETNKSHINQLRLNKLPIFQYDMYSNEYGFDTFTIDNFGDNYAFDLNVLIIFHFDNNILNKELFIKERMKTSYHNRDKDQLKENYQWVLHYNHTKPNLPKNGSLSFVMKRPEYCQGIDILVQYRDVLGNNYIQNLYYEIEDNHFHEPIIEPNILTPLSRFIIQSNSIENIHTEFLKEIQESINITISESKMIDRIIDSEPQLFIKN